MEYRSGGLLFTSKFDSGNLSRVERVHHDDDDDPSTHRVGDTCVTPDFEFNVWTNPDCVATEFENGNRTWFHFAIKGCPMNKLVKINVMNLNKQGKLYSQGMSPVVKVVPQKAKWERIRDRPTYETVNGQFIMSFTYRFEFRFSAVYFAFCYPFSYTEYQTKLEELDSKFADAKKLSPSSPVNSLYYHRELLCYSRDRLRVDIVTISSCHGITNEVEPRLDRLFPDKETPRAKRFKRKKVFFVSSRVHPGETPASFVFNGFIDFILRPKDPRAIQLRKQYVFKLVPLLNPDGVQRGHYRTDQRGVNLNRMYLNPDPELHPSIFAAKSIIMYHHAHSRVKTGAEIVSPIEKVERSISRSESQRPSANKQSGQRTSSAVTHQNDLMASDDNNTGLDLDNLAEFKKPTAIVMVHNGNGVFNNVNTPTDNEGASGDIGAPSGDASAHCQSDANDVATPCLDGLPDGYQTTSRPMSSITREGSLEDTDGEDGDLCQKTSSLSLADTTAVTTPTTPSFSEEDLLAIPPQESGVAFYVDLHGHASKRGCFIYGNHLNIIEDQIENMLYPKLIAMNSAYFDFDGCNFSEKNMYSKDKKDGMSKEGSGRVGMFKATGIIHSYTLECNYNTGRFMNSLSPATMDDGRATPPPIAGIPPKYTIAHYEDVGKAVAIAALDMTDTNPWSRIAATEYMSVHGVRGWVQRYLRSMKGAPKLPSKMSRVASKTSSIVASATTHSSIHNRARQALSDTAAHQTAVHSSGYGVTSNHGSNNSSNRRPPMSRHLGPVRDTRASLERKKRSVHLQSTHYNQSATSSTSPSTYTTTSPHSVSPHSNVNIAFGSVSPAGSNASHGSVGQSRPQTLSLTHKNAGPHANNNSNMPSANHVKATNLHQTTSQRILSKGRKKIVEELLHHMVVNSLDNPKKTSNKDTETSRLHAAEARPLGQPAGEARLMHQPPKSIPIPRGFQPGNTKKKVGGAKGDEMKKLDNKLDKNPGVSPKRQRRKMANFKRRSSSYSPTRKASLGRKGSETDSEGDLKNVLNRTRASTMASASYSDPSSSVGEHQETGSSSQAIAHLYPQSEKISPRRRSTGGSTPEPSLIRPAMDHMTAPQSITTRSLSPNATISCQLLDLNAIHGSSKPNKNTNYWTES